MKIHLSLDITSNLVFKNNIFCSAGFEKSSFGGYYGISGNREPDEFLLLPMKGFVEEKLHFLCKLHQATTGVSRGCDEYLGISLFRPGILVPTPKK